MNDNPYASFGNEGARAAFDVDPRALTLRATFILDHPTLHRALRLHLARLRGIRWFMNLAILALTPPLILLRKPTHPMVTIPTFLVLAVVMLNSPFPFYVVSSLTLRLLRLRAAPGIFCQHTIEVKEGEFVESTDVNRSAFKLKAIANLHQQAGLLVIALPGGAIIAIPESADFGGDSFETFCGKLRAAVDSAKASNAVGTSP